jgi:hypothetical protein
LCDAAAQDTNPRCIIPLEGLAVRLNNQWKGYACFEIYDPTGVRQITAI